MEFDIQIIEPLVPFIPLILLGINGICALVKNTAVNKTYIPFVAVGTGMIMCLSFYLHPASAIVGLLLGLQAVGLYEGFKVFKTVTTDPQPLPPQPTKPNVDGITPPR